jgi:hypothetical protein
MEVASLECGPKLLPTATEPNRAEDVACPEAILSLF